MKFKEWLINEDGFGGGSDGGTSWDLLYPTVAGDYASANSSPLSHFALQWKWDRGTDPDIGRVLHNIDNDEFQKVNYASIKSANMPDAGDGFWEHKPDDGSKSSVEPYTLPELKWLVVGKTHKETKYIDSDQAGKVRIWAGHQGPTSTVDDTELDDIFHDEDTHTHKWPTINPEFMDAEWTKKFESYVAEWGLAAGVASALPQSGHASDGEYNRMMPVKSKHSTKDGQNDGDDPTSGPDAEKMFIGNKRNTPKDKKKMIRGINRNRNINPKRNDVSDIIY